MVRSRMASSHTQEPDRVDGTGLVEFFVREVLVDIGRVLTSSPHLDDVYGQFARHVARIIPFDRLSLASINEDNWSFVVTNEAGRQLHSFDLGTDYPLDGSLKEKAATKHAVVIVADMQNHGVIPDLPFLRSPSDAGLRSVMEVPLVWRNRVVAVLTFFSNCPGYYTETHAALAERVAAQATGAITNAKSRAALQSDLDDSRTLLEVSRIVNASPRSGEWFGEFVKNVRQLIPHDRLALSLVDKNSDQYVRLLASGVEVPGWESGQAHRISPFVREALRRRSSMIFIAGEVYPELHTAPFEDDGTRAGLESVLVVPMVQSFNSEPSGILWFRSHTRDAFTKKHLELANDIGRLSVGSMLNTGLFHDTARQLREQLALQDLNAAICTVSTVREFLEQVAQSLPGVIDFDEIEIRMTPFLFRGSPDGLSYRQVRSEDALDGQGTDPTLLLETTSRRESDSNPGQSWNESRDYHSDGSDARVDDEGTWLAIDLHSDEKTVGHLRLKRDRGSGFEECDHLLMKQVAFVLSAGLRHLRRIRLLALEVDIRHLTARLVEMRDQLEDPGTFWHEAARGTHQIFGATCVTIATVRRLEVPRVQIVAHSCELVDVEHDLKEIQSTIATMLNSEQSAEMDRVAPDLTPPSKYPLSTRLPIGIFVPISRDGLLVGALFLQMPSGQSTPGEFEELMQHLAVVLASGCESAADEKKSQSEDVGHRIRPIRAIVVDEHARCRASLIALFRTSRVQIVADAPPGMAASLVDQSGSVVVISGLHPNTGDECDWFGEVKRQRSTLGILSIVDSSNLETVKNALRAGASGLVAAGSDPELLASAVEQVARGGAVLDREMLNRLTPSQTATSLKNGQITHSNIAAFEAMSSRDKAILAGIAAGESNTQIAGRLNLATGTVKNRTGHIYRVLDIENRAQAAYIAAVLQVGVQDDFAAIKDGVISEEGSRFNGDATA